MSKVFLTGATGFIGSHILEALSKEGFKVVCLARRDSDISFVKDHAFEICCGDIREKESFGSAVAKCDAVVHAAARASDWGSWDDFYSVNVRGLMNVIQECARCGTKNVIITGTNSSYGEENSAEVKNEDSGFNPHYYYFLDGIFPCKMNYYRDTKTMGIVQACAFARENGMNLTVIEPVFAFGEREMHTGFFEYVSSVKAGMRFMPGSRRNAFHVVYAADLARAYVLALRKRLNGVHRFIVANPAPQPMHRIFFAFCEAAGVKPPRLLPKWIAYPAGLMLELLYTLFKSKKVPLLTRGRVNMFYDSISYSAQRAAQMLDFKCEYAFEDAVAKTIAWYKCKKLL